MEYDKRISWEAAVSEDEASSMATDSVFEVLPVSEPVDRLVLTHL